jgi:TonB family protein
MAGRMKPKKLLMIGVAALLASAVSAQQTDAPRPKKLRVSQRVMAGQLIHRVEPEYPEAAKAQGISGVVIVQLQIDSEGHVAQTNIVSGDPLLTEAAVNAIKQWQFKPYTLDGEPVEVETTASVRVGLPQMLRVSQGVMEGNVVRKVNPVYPVEARAARIQGDVILEVTISREGDVSHLAVISGHPLLADAATNAVKQWKYKPYLLNGNPVEIESTIKIQFHM